jgi:hypothetical protein
MTPIKVFFCEATGDGVCVENYWCDCGRWTKVNVGRFKEADRPKMPSGKTVTCEGCGKPVAISSQNFGRIYRRADTGAEVGGEDALPPGAVYENGYQTGPDGRALACVCPDGHHWHIDGRASNCTMKDDKVHRCWVRHGRPEDGTLHVDKNGVTCAAGAGSIATGKWHGFLHKGHLKAC